MHLKELNNHTKATSKTPGVGVSVAKNKLFSSLLWVLNESFIYKRIPKQISA
jgi:hypothetical protein